MYIKGDNTQTVKQVQRDGSKFSYLRLEHKVYA